MDAQPRISSRRRLTVWTLASSLGTVGAILLVVTRGISAWVGLILLVAAVILGFFDGYKGWSERGS